jgi:hypothetical protein
MQKYISEAPNVSAGWRAWELGPLPWGRIPDIFSKPMETATKPGEAGSKPAEAKSKDFSSEKLGCSMR